MFQLANEKLQNKEEMYEQLLLSAKGLMEGETDFIANIANISALIYHSMADINWAGFYLFKENQLVLGPFNGKPACIRINIGKGVCGKAVMNRQTVVVKNVHEFEGHIACDSETLSEIVVPMIKDGELIGVLDIDSTQLEKFDAIDHSNLEVLVKMILEACKV